MKEAAAEIFLAMLSVAMLSAGQIAMGGSVYLYLFLLAGTTAGAILVIKGGKNYTIFDTGASGPVAKFISHVAVVIGFGPLALDWALKAMPDRPPEAVALATGITLSLLGTTALLRIAPMIGLVFNLIRWKISPTPLPGQTQTADSATTVTQIPPSPPPTGPIPPPNPGGDPNPPPPPFPPKT